MVNTQNSFLPKVSVVIPIYNGEADLPDLISCLLSQTYPKAQVEYLLVDNHSRDSHPCYPKNHRGKFCHQPSTPE